MKGGYQYKRSHSFKVSLRAGRKLAIVGVPLVWNASTQGETFPDGVATAAGTCEGAGGRG